MLAVCTSDYGEMTASPYSSFAELKYATEYNLDVLPLQVEQEWKPNPPCGEGHLDTEELAPAYIGMVFYPSRVRVDCRNKSIEQIASEIAAVLRKGQPGGCGGVSGISKSPPPPPPPPPPPAPPP